MAVRRTRSVAEKNASDFVDVSPVLGKGGKFRIPRWLVWVLLVVAGLIAYWYKTNTWPIVAVVGLKPVTRYEIDRSLFAKGGAMEVKNKITEIQVAMELKKLGVVVSDADVDAKLTEIKTGLGEGADIEELLLTRGMTLDEYKKQLRLLMGAEKAVSAGVTVTDEEVGRYLQITDGSATDAAQLQNARESVRLSKVDSEINTWVEELNSKYKVWKMPGLEL